MIFTSDPLIFFLTWLWMMGLQTKWPIARDIGAIVMVVKKKSRKAKKINKIKQIEQQLSMAGWNTTDTHEIERRRLRAQTEKFRIVNLEPEYLYFSSFAISSQSGAKYVVEIRSLLDFINSCNCPDYLSNGLGTCKHIEHILLRLKKSGKKLFFQASIEGSTRTEIFLDRRNNATICIKWPQKVNPRVRQVLEPFFSTDGNLLAALTMTYPALKRAIAENKKAVIKHMRLSDHMDDVIEMQQRAVHKKISREIFLADVQLGKRNLDVVKFPLYSYQQTGMLHLAFTERALLADEMGLGKTVQAIAACELLRRLNKVQKVLVIATASLKAEWEEQIAKFTGLSNIIIQGPRAERLKQYQTSSFFYLANYEQILMDGPEIQRLISPDVIILDEAQRIKNWQTKTANAVKRLTSPYAFVLTGTPLENRIDDIYSVIQFLDPYLFGSLFRFNRDFYQLDQDGKPAGYKNLDELNRRLRPIMLRRRKGDVEEQLPDRTINNYFVGMDEEQQVRYGEYNDRVARLLAEAKRRPLRKEELEKLQRWLACMRMLCDTPYILDPECKISPKLRELKNILEELLEDPTAKIIIFSEWERMLQLVRDLAEKMNLNFAWHTGSVPQHKRRQDIKRFKEQPDCRLFLSTDSGSVGLNLQSANIVINLDLPWNPAKLEQRIARAWRKHQMRSVRVINLVCENSIEHRMLDLLAQKQALAQGVLEGGDLKEMKLPSGRVAFMERMNQLMGTSVNVVAPTVLPPDSSASITPESTQNNTTDKLLETLDHDTYDLIQRLAQSGIITINNQDKILQASQRIAESRKQLQEKQITHARKNLVIAERKHKMAHVLMEGEFQAEAMAILRDALEAMIHSFAWLNNKGDVIPNEIASHGFIKNELIDRHGLPNQTLILLEQLHNKIDEIPQDHVPKIFIDCQKIFQHVDEAINKTALGLG